MSDVSEESGISELFGISLSVKYSQAVNVNMKTAANKIKVIHNKAF